ncbi:hypothetical protein L345_17749, partial [Ophiophagus hannah]
MDFQVIPSESLQNKASTLQLKGSLEASFFGGLFEVGGAATYLQAKPPSMNHARGSLHLSVATESKDLPTSLLNRKSVSYQEAFEEGSATHVVTAVLYGAQVFFVFDCGVSESAGVRDTQRHLLEMIEKIPKVADAHQRRDGEREMEGRIRCTLYSDIPLGNPTTFQEAVDIFAGFPQLSRERGKAVPVKVWLYPLIKLHPKAARVVRDPALDWLKEAEAHLQALIDADIDCNDLIKSPAAVSFPVMKDHLEQLRQLCGQHGQIFQQEVGKALLAVRGGKEEAAVLRGVLMRLTRSPFHKEALKELLGRKKQKMDFVKLCLSRLEGLEVVSTQKLDEILFDCRNKVVVAFMLTSLQREEPSLEELRAWLQRAHLGGNGDSATAVPYSKKQPSKLWFEDEETKRRIRCAVSSLSDFAGIHRERDNVRFLVSSVWDESYPGASVYLYENGMLVNDHLELPSRPAPPKVELVQPDSAQITVNPVSFGAGSVSGYEVQYQIGGNEWTSLQTGPSDRLTLHVRFDIKYQFRCAAVTQLGLSQWSEVAWVCPRGKPAEVTGGLPRSSLAEWEEEVGEGEEEDLKEEEEEEERKRKR